MQSGWLNLWKSLAGACAALSLLACAPSGSPVEERGTPVSERSFVTLGGEEQYVEITGSDDRNPVLLFIHGGPGWPQTPSIRAFNSEIAERLTLVVWEQRGAGQSYVKNPEPPDVSLRQIVADAHELTRLLQSRFRKDSIYLAGYSWGSIVGLELAMRYPQDYAAYAGIAQVVNMRRAMEVSRQWLAERALEHHDRDTLAALEKLENPPTDVCADDLGCFLKQYELITKYGGATYVRDLDQKIEAATATYEDYANYDWMAAYRFSSDHLKDDLFSTDFSRVSTLALPVCFFVGRHDHTVPGTLVEEFARNLAAPKKEVIWMERSGHAMMEEEPETFNRLLVDALLGRRPGA